VPTVTLVRRAGGWVDRARKYKVLIDGDQVGEIAPGARERFEVLPGTHDVMLKIDWARSQPLRLELAENDEAELFCEPKANLINAPYFATFGRKKYIELRRG
jgi:hypothetical protein